MTTERKTRSVRTQLGQFVMLPRWVLERVKAVVEAEGKDADAAARAVYVYAVLGAKYANHEQRAWPKRELLAADVGVSLPVVARALRILRAAGALKTERRHRADGAVIGLEYILVQVDPGTPAVKPAGQHHQVPPDTKASADHPIPPDSMAAADHQVPADTMADAIGSPGISPSDPRGSGLLKEEPDPLNHIRTDPSTAAPPTGRPRTLLDDFHDGFQARFGVAPNIVGAKDGKLMKLLVAGHGADRVRELLGWFFRIRDPFINHTGYSVGVFYACFNKLQVTYRAPETAAEDRADLLRQMRARGEARRQALEAEAEAAIAALAPAAREALQRLVVEEFTRGYPDLIRHMTREQHQAAVCGQMVQHVVDQCSGGQSVAEVVQQFERSHAA